MGETVHIPERLITLNDPRDVLAVKEPLGLALPEADMLCRIDEDNFTAPGVGSGLVQHADRDGYARPEEEVLGQAGGETVHPRTRTSSTVPAWSIHPSSMASRCDISLSWSCPIQHSALDSHGAFSFSFRVDRLVSADPFGVRVPL